MVRSYLLKLNFNIHSILHFSVCACGKWTCTSEICIEGYRDIENRVHEDDGDWGDEDAEDPEDDPDVQDIRWF